MRAKVIVQSVLLVLLGASVVTWAVKSFGEGDPSSSPGEAVAVSPAAAVVLADGVAVINFHGVRR